MAGITPGTRLFLSVDVVGSTKLKEEYNVTRLESRLSERRGIINNIKRHVNAQVPGNSINLETLGLRDFFPETDLLQSDWPTIIAGLFQDFHTSFENKCSALGLRFTRESLWKFLGDEIVYSFKVDDVGLTHKLCLCFLESLRLIDGRSLSFGAKRKLRVKGTAWIANFPVRNRVITLLDNEDYLGQDLDIGFRISKFSHPLVLCVSMDLAYLLGNTDTKDQLTGAVVGWEALKGIWGEIPYPIIWVCPPKHLKSHAESDFPLWESEDNDLLSSFMSRVQQKGRLETLEDLKAKLKPIVDKLGPRLGIGEPYIYDGSIESMPDDDRRVFELLQELDRAAKQTESEPDSTPSDAQQVSLPPHLNSSAELKRNGRPDPNIPDGHSGRRKAGRRHV